MTHKLPVVTAARVRKRECDLKYQERKKKENKAAFYAKNNEACKKYRKNQKDIHSKSKRAARANQRYETERKRAWRLQKQQQASESLSQSIPTVVASSPVGLTCPSTSRIEKSLSQSSVQQPTSICSPMDSTNSRRRAAALAREKRRRRETQLELKKKLQLLQQQNWRLAKQIYRKVTLPTRAAKQEMTAAERHKANRHLLHANSRKHLQKLRRAREERARLEAAEVTLDIMAKFKRSKPILKMVKKICRKAHHNARRFLVRKLRLDYWTIANPESDDEQVRATSKPRDLEARVVAFLLRDDNSRMSSCKKDVVPGPDGKMQKRFLNFSVDLLFEKFCSENPDDKICQSTFYNLLQKAFYVVQPRLSDRSLCLCARCANFQLIVNALFLKQMVNTREKYHLVRQLVCNSDAKACMYRECNDCRDNSVLQPLADAAPETLTYQQWELTMCERTKFKSTQLIKKTASLQDSIAHFNELLGKFCAHDLRVKHQLRAILDVQENLAPGHAILHIDFLENYSRKYSAESQASHFGFRPEIVIHQGILYLADCEPTSFATVSMDKTKTSAAILAHLRPILDHCQVVVPSLQEVTIISDSLSSQYRNKGTLFLFQREMAGRGISNWQWLYSEAGHSKGAPDSVGAALKCTCDRAVATGATVNSIPELQAAINGRRSVESSILLIEVTTNDISVYTNVLESERDRIPPMVGIGQTHHVRKSEGSAIFYRELACHCSANCLCFDAKVWELPNAADQLDVPEAAENLQTVFVNIIELELPKTPQLNEFVAVVYDTAWFLGQVTAVTGEMINVNFMRQLGKSDRFTWPATQDTDEIKASSVLAVCQAPPELLPGINRHSVMRLNERDFERIESSYEQMAAAEGQRI